MFDSFRGGEDVGVPTRKPSHCPVRSKFGKNISRLRLSNGLTQEALAEKVGISARYVQSVEAGEYFPALPTLVKLRRVLSADWDDVFARCEE